MDKNGMLKSVLKSSSTGVTGLVSKVRNIEGNLRMHVRNVTFMKPVNDVAGHKVHIDDEQELVEGVATNRDGSHVLQNVSSCWEDPNVHHMKSSFVNIVAAKKEVPKLNFRTLLSASQVEEANCVLPVKHIIIAQ
nr:hypothetical protein [Tanacetum cinerariifolium]